MTATAAAPKLAPAPAPVTAKEIVSAPPAPVAANTASEQPARAARFGDKTIAVPTIEGIDLKVTAQAITAYLKECIPDTAKFVEAAATVPSTDFPNTRDGKAAWLFVTAIERLLKIDRGFAAKPVREKTPRVTKTARQKTALEKLKALNPDMLASLRAALGDDADALLK
ncbi:MAG: hypothetical protein H0X04_00280 [Chthoniobacterales bacterium]|nr:hypothetical protein [Chthoniobacterales bacterium]